MVSFRRQIIKKKFSRYIYSSHYAQQSICITKISLYVKQLLYYSMWNVIRISNQLHGTMELGFDPYSSVVNHFARKKPGFDSPSRHKNTNSCYCSGRVVDSFVFGKFCQEN